MTMLQEFLGFPRLDTVYWSLTVELAFYVIAGMLFALGLHKHRLAFVATWLACSALWMSTAPDISREHPSWIALLLALDFSPYFGIGIVFFDVSKRGWSFSCLGLLIFALATEYLIAGWEGLCVALVATALFASAMRGHLKFLVTAPTIWLGTISYSLYLIHRNLGYAVLDWFHEQGVSAGIALPITIIGALGLATLITYSVEKPALRHIRAWYRTRRLQRDNSGA